MPLEIVQSPDPEPAGLVADRRLYLAAAEPTVVDARPGHLVVEEDDPRAAFLLAAPGSLIPEAQVRALGLELVDGKVVQRSAEKVAAPAPEPEAESTPEPTLAVEPPKQNSRARGR